MQRIVCAAIRNKAGDIICSARHYDMGMHKRIADSNSDWTKGQIEQGFIDQFCQFLTREEAWVIALAAGQIIKRVGSDRDCLYSENLY